MRMLRAASLRPTALGRFHLVASAAALTLVVTGASAPSARSDAAAPGVAPASPVARLPSSALLHARLTLTDGTTRSGRIRFGGDEEAMWLHQFNGRKRGNPWARYVPGDARPRTRETLSLFGVALWHWDRARPLDRPFLARIGDIAHVDTERRTFRITMRNGTVHVLDRFEADDLADGVRVWDATRGVEDIDEWDIRRIAFLDAPDAGAPATLEETPLHGVVRTRQGTFTGFVQWSRQASLLGDLLRGQTAAGDREIAIPFSAVRSVTRHPAGGFVVTRHEGADLRLTDDRFVGVEQRGLYVDDARYGRVLVSWDAFEAIDLTAGGAAPSRADFVPGRPLRGRVTTRDGRQFTGRLVYDLDESETTESLDAPSHGVDWQIPFGRIAMIEPADPRGGPTALARVTLVDGGTLALEATGDLGTAHLGMLVFGETGGAPAYVPWEQVARIEFGEVGPSVVRR